MTSAQAAEALRPIAGPFAFAVFALGIIGTGLLAVPVLAGFRRLRHRRGEEVAGRTGPPAAAGEGFLRHSGRRHRRRRRHQFFSRWTR